LRAGEERFRTLLGKWRLARDTRAYVLEARGLLDAADLVSEQKAELAAQLEWASQEYYQTPFDGHGIQIGGSGTRTHRRRKGVAPRARAGSGREPARSARLGDREDCRRGTLRRLSQWSSLRLAVLLALRREGSRAHRWRLG